MLIGIAPAGSGQTEYDLVHSGGSPDSIMAPMADGGQGEGGVLGFDTKAGAKPTRVLRDDLRLRLCERIERHSRLAFSDTPHPRLRESSRLTRGPSGYRIFSRRFVKSFPALASGFEIETEPRVHALELRMPVAEAGNQVH